MKIVILGAGVSGHTAAFHLKRLLSSEHEIVVVSPNSKWNWIPSNIWVGVGDMKEEQVTFELEPVYKRMKIKFIQARATEIYPEGLNESKRGFVKAESTNKSNLGEVLSIDYDFLINATGPRLNFAATPGLGPEGHSLSVCTYSHATETAKKLDEIVGEMKNGVEKTFIVGTGHGLCTCEGAAFEYVFNLEFELRKRGVRDKAKIIFVTNEAILGDFGVGGLNIKMGGYVTPSKVFAESLFVERGVDWITGTHVKKVEKNLIEYETLDGEIHTLNFDFAMLLPPFTGVPLKAFNNANEDISNKLFNPSGFMKVDADYNQKPYEQWLPEDWPKTYQTQYKNVFAIGIAFAPPHQISRPLKTKNGTIIAPAPPRTGMPSGVMGKIVAKSITEMIKNNNLEPAYSASMAELGAACVASAGASILNGSAASMTMYPIVPNYNLYPAFGRDTNYTTGEIGSAGHWIKKILHYMFIYKAKGYLFWWLIPE
ncbi:NAD(P)/FAD-dependent oxidoreductase [Spirobacillus cienkowskii]|uniref:NAD(P)/FAD-dependent oxidoreductase n=1 Tax=Spirobacillus cienkowskii TaxID=495820 RepID=UPI0030D24BC7